MPGVGESDLVVMPAGCIDQDPGIRPTEQLHTESKAPWFQPARPGMAPVSVGNDGPLAGSCLCGTVAYEIRVPLDAVRSCHCSRCRKARAAAHTVNGFAPMSGVVFARGEQDLTTYKLPSARFFSQTFCRHCGSGMPRIDPSVAWQ